MNIFFLDKDPVKAAAFLCDRHVSKMILESAQMLSSVADKYGHPTLYKPTHRKHPSTLWAGERYANWIWLIEHSLAMEEEKIRRTGVGHSSADVIRWYRDNNYGPPQDDLPMTPFAQAMPQQYKNFDDPVSAYRNYYLGDKQFFKDGKRPTWTNSNPPDWWYFKV